GRQLRKSLVLALRPAVFNRHVLTFDEAGFLETLAERAQTVCIHVGRVDAHKSDYWNCALLRPRRERPRNRAAEQRDELAAFHAPWMSWSAGASSIAGMSRLSERAVCKLRTNSNLADCRTGRSAGLAPLRMLPV